MKFRILLPIVFFALGITLTLVLARRLVKKPPASPPAVDVRDIPGLADGEVVTWPKVEDLSGKSLRLDAQAGQYLFVAVFSSGCEGCERDADFWKRSISEAKRKNLSLCLLAIDNDPDPVRNFVTRFGLNDARVLFDRYGEAAADLKIHMVPQYLLLSRDGRVVGRWSGLSHFNSKREKVPDPALMFSLIN